MHASNTRFFSISAAPPALRNRVMLISALTAAVLSGCGNGGAEAPPPGPPPVSVAPALERQVAEWDEFSGRIEAVESVQLSPRVGGYLQSIHFKYGSMVKKGDLLFQIDPRPFQAEVARAEAALASAKARADLARTELVRAERLLKDSMVARREYDTRASGQRDAEAAVRAAQAALRTARLNLEYTSIRAPISGRIGRAETTVGNLVQGEGPSPTVLTTIVSIDPIYAAFEGDEQVYLKYVAMARGGERPSSRTTPNPVLMGLANEQGFPHTGRMEFVDNRLDPQTGTIRVRAVFDNKDGRLTPGLFARIKLVGSGSYQAVLINDRAVGTDQSKKFVLVLDSENKASYRPVSLGPLVDGLRVVKQGLKAGEVIVVNGIQRVRPGMQVAPQTVSMENPEPPASPSAAMPAGETGGGAAPAQGDAVSGKPKS